MFRRASFVLRHYVTCEQVRSVVSEKLAGNASTHNTYLIDVRTPEEVQRYGTIPTSINIPLNVVQDVLGAEVSEEEFEATYRVPKPTPDAHQLIFFCQAGMRSASATDIAEGLGFRSVANFGGSFAEWYNTYGASAK